jgi:hypothetical protein
MLRPRFDTGLIADQVIADFNQYGGDPAIIAMDRYGVILCATGLIRYVGPDIEAGVTQACNDFMPKGFSLGKQDARLPCPCLTFEDRGEAVDADKTSRQALTLTLIKIVADRLMKRPEHDVCAALPLDMIKPDITGDSRIFG